MNNVVEQFAKIAALSPGLPAEVVNMAKSIPDPGVLADMVTSTINSKLEEIV